MIKTLILPKGSYLFHGTCEPLSGRLKPGGDGLVWFADNPAIAQLYICQHPVTTYFTSENLLDTNDKGHHTEALRDYLGVYYDGHLWQMPDPQGWQPSKSLSDWEEHIENWKRELETIWDDLTPEEREKHQQNMRERRWRLTDMKRKDAYRKVEQLLKQSPIEYDEYLKRWKVGFSHGEVQPEPAVGTLVVARTKRDMTLWNKATGEGDLLNVQYNDIRGFKDAQKAGLDGVLIDDFAQSEEWGNFGHLSVGLFKHAIPFLEIKKVTASYREWDRKKTTPEWGGPVSSFKSLRAKSARVASRWLSAYKDRLPGGLADKKKPGDFDPEQLEKGW